MLGRNSNHYRAATPGPATIALAVGMLAGALLAVQLTVPSRWMCGLALLAGLLFLKRGRWLGAGVLLGLACAGASLEQALGNRLDVALDSQQLEIVGVVADLPQHETRRLVLTLRIESPRELPARVRISWYEPSAVPSPGERWRFRAKLQRPRGLINSGSASREGWLLRQRIGATGYASGPGAGERLAIGADRLLQLRGHSAMLIQNAVHDRRAAAVLTAIALGFRGGLDGPTREALVATGTGHLLAISGLHIGLAAAAGGMLGGAIGSTLGARRRPARDWAALGALCMACAYCLLAGMPVSARRAVLMTAAGLAALVARRGGSLGVAFGGALAAVLIADPLAVLDPGLWLSFGAVATILAVVAARRSSPARIRMLLRIQAALAVGLLVCTVAWFGRISLVAPLANLFAVPWFSILVVPPVLAGVVVSWILPGAGALLLGFAAETTSLALTAIEYAARLPLASRWVAAPGGVALVFAAIGAGWCLLPRPAPGRALAPLLFAPLLFAGPPPLSPGSFELRVFDVGHGLAVLVRTRNRVMLYDAGPSWPGGDAAEFTVLPAMRALGVRRLDAFMISHGHADHMGGAGAVRAAFARAPSWGGYGAEQAGARACREGLSWAWDGVRFSVLHPAEGFRGGLNDGSCVVLIEAPGGRVLLTGDIEARGERALLTARARVAADVVVAPHHGSRTSSGPALVAATRPAWVIFSTNWRNRWGFPAEMVVARWQRAGALPLSTERHGEILMRFDRHGPVPPVVRRQIDCRAWLDCATF